MPKYDFPNPIFQNGHWSFTASLGIDPETGKRVQRRRGGFRTKGEAEAAYRKLKDEWDAKQAIRAADAVTPSLTFGQFVTDDFLPAYQGSVRPQTYRGRAAMIDKNFQTLWDLELSRISPQEILNWRRGCQRAGLSSDYVRKIYGLCERIFAMAVKIDLVSTNPAEVLKDFKIKHDERHAQFLDLVRISKGGGFLFPCQNAGRMGTDGALVSVSVRPAHRRGTGAGVERYRLPKSLCGRQ